VTEKYLSQCAVSPKELSVIEKGIVLIFVLNCKTCNQLHAIKTYYLGKKSEDGYRKKQVLYHLILSGN